MSTRRVAIRAACVASGVALALVAACYETPVNEPDRGAVLAAVAAAEADAAIYASVRAVVAVHATASAHEAARVDALSQTTAARAALDAAPLADDAVRETLTSAVSAVETAASQLGAGVSVMALRTARGSLPPAVQAVAESHAAAQAERDRLAAEEAARAEAERLAALIRQRRSEARSPRAGTQAPSNPRQSVTPRSSQSGHQDLTVDGTFVMGEHGLVLLTLRPFGPRRRI
ncbi:hypothetical protein OMK64_01855 [Cellulomonas fimi]|uniref:hypothetical protein n=1 Tax=Cellulomonas fimi TaxID=1708 RepID=UPI00234CA67C|nr:hypothetical protein [Cellulomonas fimi]MDC7120277.1 hypothetical protein [Cellulomonas fimi]